MEEEKFGGFFFLSLVEGDQSRYLVQHLPAQLLLLISPYERSLNVFFLD
ncbi:hypothetical protein [Levilactobacillus enshiensis]|nr:hypothetical protein [Levilactobacillus enshiensis]